jgi:hypothetical protein
MDQRPSPPRPPGQQAQRTIRTFQNDMSEHIQTTPMSVARIAIAQHSKDNDDGSGSVVISNDSHPDRSVLKKIILVLLSVMFVSSGLIGGYYFYTKSMLATVTPIIIEDDVDEKIMTTQQTRTAAWSQNLRPTLSAIIADEAGLTTQLSESAEIIISKDPTALPLVPISSTEFLSSIGTKAPSTLVRALEDNFMVGVYRGPERDAPFIILKETNFQNSYAGLLLWENDMLEDLSWLLLPKEAENNIVLTSNVQAFHDSIIKNKDSRILKTKQGNQLISYAFVDEKTIIITTDTLTLSALIDIIEKEAFVRKK